MKKLLAVLLLLVLAAQPLLCMSTASAGSPNQTAVAYMEARFQCGCTWNGCGTMIAKNGLITAGHCLVCFTHNKPLKSCNFYFKRQKSGTCFYKYTGNFSAYCYADFSRGYSMEDDIGYVVFPTNIGNETGWYASSAESDYDINWEFCHMYGYSGGGMISDWAQVNVVDSKTVSWEASSEFRSGTQGGPIFYDYEGLDYPVLVGVYTTCGGTTAYARRLKNSIYSDMKAAGVIFN